MRTHLSKRLIATLLCLVMAMGTFTVPVAAAEEEQILQFSDDFSQGNFFWDLNHLTATSVKGGKLAFLKNSGYEGFNKFRDTVQFYDGTLTMDFKMKGYLEGKDPWVGFYFRNYIINMRPGTTSIGYMSYDTSKGLGGKIGDFSEGFEWNKDYTIKITGEGEYIVVSVKSADGSFVEVGGFVDTMQTPGPVGVRTSCCECDFDNFSFYAPEGATGVFAKKAVKVPFGKPLQLEFISKGEGSVTYTSADSSIVSVDEKGMAIANKVGQTVITATDASGKVLDTCLVAGYRNVANLITYGDLTVPVGENIEIGIGYNPADATAKGTIWESSDPSVVQLISNPEAFEYGVVKGIKPGTAEVIVTSVDDTKPSCRVKVTVTEPKTPGEKETVSFALNGRVKPLIKTSFGLHYDKIISSDGSPYITDITLDAIEKAGFQSVRSHGAKANRYVWQTGKNYGQGYPEGFEGYSQEDIYKIANTLDIPFINAIALARPGDENGVLIPWEELEYVAGDYGVTRATIPMEEQLPFVDLMKETAEQETIYIELGNELYGMGTAEDFPTVDDYVAYCNEYIAAIKKEHPDVKIAPLAFDRALERRIIADPNNFRMDENDWAYTQGTRTWDWNPKIETIVGKDAITAHNYFYFEKIHNNTYDEVRDELYAKLEEDYYGVLTLWDQFGVPSWLTEVGTHTGASNSNSSYYSHTPMMAAWNMEQFLGYVWAENTQFVNWHDLGHPGYGMRYQEGGRGPWYLSPRYFAFQKLGDLVERFDTCYNLDMVEGDYRAIPHPDFSGDIAFDVPIADGKAWGFGDADGLKEVVLVNKTSEEKEFRLEGAQLSKTWSLDSDTYNRADFVDLKSSTQYSVLEESGELPAGFSIYETDSFADSITLKPYEIVVAKVQGTPATIENSTANLIGPTNYWYFRDALVLKLEKNYAYSNNVKTKIDENDAIVPTTKNDRTLLPLRFIAEEMGAEVSYDDATRVITIKGDDREIIFTVGSTEYSVNGEKMTLETAPEVTEGRTLVPLRALCEALGKYVFWDERNTGLIAISDYSLLFKPGTYRDEVYPSLVDEALTLFE